MKPGQGYQLNVSQASTLLYPANSGAALLKESSSEEPSVPENKYYPFAFRQSSVNYTLIVLNENAKDGDEAGVFDQQNILVGGGVFRDGKAAVVVYGNESITDETDEGAEENELLNVYTYSSGTGSVNAAVDAVENLDGSVSGQLVFKNNSAGIIRISSSGTVPLEFNVYQNYPNPFNPETVISFDIAQAGLVKLDVFDIMGQKVASLVDEVKDAGRYNVKFNASALSTGTYFYKLVQGNNTSVKKMILIK